MGKSKDAEILKSQDLPAFVRRSEEARNALRNSNVPYTYTRVLLCIERRMERREGSRSTDNERKEKGEKVKTTPAITECTSY